MAVIADPRGGAGATGEVHTTKQNDLGIVRTMSDGMDYIYLQGVASTVTGDFVTFKQGVWTTARLAASQQGGVAIATAACVASTYGWYGYIGQFSGNCLSATLSNGYLYTTATAGSAEDVVSVGNQLKGATAIGAPLTATGGGLQVVSLNRAFVGSNDQSA